MKSDTWCAYGMNSIAAEISRLKADDKCIGLILDVDSPGGTVDGTSNLARTVAEFGKPTVGYVDGCAASAAYWVASQCDKIFLNDALDQVGSIGVAFSTMDITPALEKQGVKVFNLVANESPNKNRAVFDLFRKGDDQLLKAQMSEIYRSFRGSVTSKREGIAEECLSGHMYFAPKAMEHGMVDGIRSLEECVQEVISLHQEGNTTEHNSHNNSSTMSMKQFAAINAALGVEALEQLDGYVSLNEQSLSAIAEAMASATRATADTNALLEAANRRIAELEAAEAAAKEAHEQALAAASATNQALTAQVEALKGTTPTKPSSATSKVEPNAESRGELESLEEEMASMSAAERTEYLTKRIHASSSNS